MLALRYALDHPGRVRRLVLSHTTASTSRFTLDLVTQVPADHGLRGDRQWFATGAAQDVQDWDLEARLGEITAPTLVIHSGDDMPSMEAGRVLATGIPGAEWLAMNGNGPNGFEDKNVATYLAVIRMFLNGWEGR